MKTALIPTLVTLRLLVLPRALALPPPSHRPLLPLPLPLPLPPLIPLAPPPLTLPQRPR